MILSESQQVLVDVSPDPRPSRDNPIRSLDALHYRACDNLTLRCDEEENLGLGELLRRKRGRGEFGVDSLEDVLELSSGAQRQSKVSYMEEGERTLRLAIVSAGG